MMLLLKIPMESSNLSYLIFEILIKLFWKFILKKIECWPKIFYSNLHNISYPIEIKITTISVCADCIQASGERKMTTKTFLMEQKYSFKSGYMFKNLRYLISY